MKIELDDKWLEPFTMFAQAWWIEKVFHRPDHSEAETYKQGHTAAYPVKYCVECEEEKVRMRSQLVESKK